MTAGGQRRARDRGAAHATLAVVEAVGGEEGVNGSAVCGRDAADDDMLVGGNAEVTLVDFGDGHQPGFHAYVRMAWVAILDPPVLNEEAVVPRVLDTLRPPVAVGVGREGHVLPRGWQLPPQVLLDCFFEPLQAAVVDGVLQSR